MVYNDGKGTILKRPLNSDEADEMKCVRSKHYFEVERGINEILMKRQAKGSACLFPKFRGVREGYLCWDEILSSSSGKTIDKLPFSEIAELMQGGDEEKTQYTLLRQVRAAMATASFCSFHSAKNEYSILLVLSSHLLSLPLPLPPSPLESCPLISSHLTPPPPPPLSTGIPTTN